MDVVEFWQEVFMQSYVVSADANLAADQADIAVDRMYQAYMSQLED